MNYFFGESFKQPPWSNILWSFPGVQGKEDERRRKQPVAHGARLGRWDCQGGNSTYKSEKRPACQPKGVCVELRVEIWKSSTKALNEEEMLPCPRGFLWRWACFAWKEGSCTWVSLRKPPRILAHYLIPSMEAKSKPPSGGASLWEPSRRSITMILASPHRHGGARPLKTWKKEG